MKTVPQLEVIKKVRKGNISCDIVELMAVEVSFSVFWAFTWRKVIWYRRFKTTCLIFKSQDVFIAWTLKMEQRGSPETSVSNHRTPRSNP